MKKILGMGLAALALVAVSQDRASAWCKGNFSVGLNWTWEGGGNSFLWGLYRSSPYPGSDQLPPMFPNLGHRGPGAGPMMMPGIDPSMYGAPIAAAPIASPLPAAPAWTPPPPTPLPPPDKGGESQGKKGTEAQPVSFQHYGYQPDPYYGAQYYPGYQAYPSYYPGYSQPSYYQPSYYWYGW